MAQDNEPPRRSPGTWIVAAVQLADGSTVEVRIPAAVAASIASYEPAPGEAPSVTVVRAGRRRRGRLGQLFGGES